MSFANAQFNYDNMVPADYWDEDDAPVYERLQENFNEDFLTNEFSEKLTDLFLKVCNKTASLDDFVEFKKEAANWYESELEKYSEQNYSDVEKQMRDEAEDDEADRRFSDYCEDHDSGWYC